MLSPNADLAQQMTNDVAERLNGALHHLVAEVLSRPGWAGVADPSPAAFGLQGMMRDRALVGDLDGAVALFDRFRSVLDRPAGSGDFVRSLQEPSFTSAEIEILRWGFADDVGLTAQLLAPIPERAEAATAAIESVLRCMEQACPEWTREFRILVRWVVLSSVPGDNQPFAGGSAFDLWGAVLVNPGYQRDPLHLAMSLVHESSHLKLFHAYIDDEIVLNDPDERFSSPLRRQPRPMNGLYHAAFVLARMTSFAADMLKAGNGAGTFGEAWREMFRAEAEGDASNFSSAYEIIAQHGQLTPKGRAILAEAAGAVERSREVALAV